MFIKLVDAVINLSHIGRISYDDHQEHFEITSSLDVVMHVVFPGTPEGQALKAWIDAGMPIQRKTPKISEPTLQAFDVLAWHTTTKQPATDIEADPIDYFNPPEPQASRKVEIAGGQAVPDLSGYPGLHWSKALGCVCAEGLAVSLIAEAAAKCDFNSAHLASGLSEDKFRQALRYHAEAQQATQSAASAAAEGGVV